MPSSSDSEKDISCDNSDSYYPFHSLSSKLFKPDSDEASLGRSSSNNDDIQGKSSNNRPLTGMWFMVDGTRCEQFVLSDDSVVYGFSGISAAAIKPIDVNSKR